MANFEHLKIYKDSFQFLLKIEEIVLAMDKKALFDELEKSYKECLKKQEKYCKCSIFF